MAKTPQTQNVDDLIPDRLTQLGLTVAEAARRSGLSAQTWRNVMRHPHQHRRRNVASAIAQTLRWRHDWLERLAEGLLPVAADADHVAGADTRTAIDLSALGDEDRCYVLGVFDAVSRR